MTGEDREADLRRFLEPERVGITRALPAILAAGLAVLLPISCSTSLERPVTCHQPIAQCAQPLPR